MARRASAAGAVLLAVLAALMAPACAQTGPNTEVKLFRISGKSSGLCNDGTQPAFWYRKARPGFEDRWLIMLEGGGQCDSQVTCEAREQYFKSSLGLVAKQDLSGIFTAHDGLETGNYNLVYVHYCSSDGWHGDRVNPFPTSPLKYFQGTRVINNVFDTLFDPPSSLKLPPLEEWHAVLFGGFSAGGRGAMVNVDRVQNTYGLYNMRAYLDSPFYVDLGSNYALVAQTKGVYELFVEGSAMGQANAVYGWKDLYGEYRLPKLFVAFFVTASQLDTYQVALITGTHTRAQLVHRTRDKLWEMQPLNSCSVIFSDTSFVHSVGGSSAFFFQGYFDGKYDVRLHFLLQDFASNIGQGCDTDYVEKYIDPRGADCTDDDCPAGVVFTRSSDYMGSPATRCASDMSGGSGSFEVAWTPTFRACQDRCDDMGDACFGFEFNQDTVTCHTWKVLIATKVAASSAQSCYQKPISPIGAGRSTTTITWDVVPNTGCRDPSGGTPVDTVQLLALSWHDCMSRCIDDTDCTGIEHKAPTHCEIWKAPIASRVDASDYSCALKLWLEDFQGAAGTKCVGDASGEEAPSDAVRISSGAALSECMDLCRANERCFGANYRDGTCREHVKPIAFSAIGDASEMCLTRVPQPSLFTNGPTEMPTSKPTMLPTASPTASPSAEPTVSPTSSPTRLPSSSPTSSPTRSPSSSPTPTPTSAPNTKSPTVSPTVPTRSPTAAPSSGAQSLGGSMLGNVEEDGEAPIRAVAVMAASAAVVGLAAIGLVARRRRASAAAMPSNLAEATSGARSARSVPRSTVQVGYWVMPRLPSETDDSSDDDEYDSSTEKPSP